MGVDLPGRWGDGDHQGQASEDRCPAVPSEVTAWGLPPALEETGRISNDTKSGPEQRVRGGSRARTQTELPSLGGRARLRSGNHLAANSPEATPP